jgi:selenocysteine-specific elongation factor
VTALLVGTAGHVDHGKTALLRALTGIDCDRLPEEKRRGITLDLGYAHLERDGVEIGFVDVPGHERFLHNALAGLGGIRLLLFVVAADEGVRAQTREHLAVAELLGVPAAVVAVTKTDLVAEDFVDLVELEVGELLAPTRFAGAPVFRVSSATGEGVERLAAELLTRARSEAPAGLGEDPARLPVDRVFVVRGQGVVATGTLVRGAIAAGDALRLEPLGRDVRVRSLEVHGRARETASAVGRAALLLAGVEAGEIERGQELVGAGGPSPSRRLLARVRLLEDAPTALEGTTDVRLHLHAAETPARLRPLAPARLEPGARGLVELRPRIPLVVARGDRFVLRRLSPAATLGGGEVLDPRWRRPRGVALERRLAALSGPEDEALRAWVEAGGRAGASSSELAVRLGRTEAPVAEALARLAADGALVAGAGRWFVPSALAELEREARFLLQDYFERDRLAEEMPKAELVRKLLGRRASALAEFHLGWLSRRKVLAVDGEHVRPPGRRAALSNEETGLSGRILEVYDAAGLEPPSPAEVARRLSAKPAMVDGLVRHLVARQKLIRLPQGMILAASAFDRLCRELDATGWTRFTVGQFKERFELSRKFAIPLLERLDALSITRRAGEERQLLRPAARPPDPDSRSPIPES